MAVFCEECKENIHAFKFNLDEYVYKRGTKYFCGWACMRKWDKEHKQQNLLPFMWWEKTDEDRWDAQGKNGAFAIERIAKRYYATYKSSTYNTKLKFRPTNNLKDSKKICEQNEYWEW